MHRLLHQRINSIVCINSRLIIYRRAVVRSPANFGGGRTASRPRVTGKQLPEDGFINLIDTYKAPAKVETSNMRHVDE